MQTILRDGGVSENLGWVGESSNVVFINCPLVEIGLKFGYSEKATKFEKIFHLEVDVTE